MRKLLILLITLVAFAAAGQTNATFNNLDVRNRTTHRGYTYMYDSIYFSPSSLNIPLLNPGDPLGWFLTTSKGPEAQLVRATLASIADSIAPFLGYWYLNGDTVIVKNQYKTYLTDSVYLDRYAIPHLQAGEPVGLPLVTRKLSGSSIGQLAFATWPMFIDTLFANGGSYWYEKTEDTIGTNYHVVVDSSFLMRYGDYYMGYGDVFGNGWNNIGIGTANGFGDFHITEDEPGQELTSMRYGSQIITCYKYDGITIVSDTGNIEITTDTVNITASPVNIDGDLVVTGEFYHEPPHAFLSYKVTGNDTIGGSSAGNLIAIATRWQWTNFALGFTDVETHLFTLIATDTLQFNGEADGHIHFIVPLTVDGSNNTDWEAAIFNVTDAPTTPISTRQAFTTTGSGNKNCITLSVYDVAADPGDKYVMKVRNLTSTDDLNIFFCDIFANMIHYE